MRQARPKWELERSIRRQLLRERVLLFLGGVAVALAFFALMLLLGSLA
jgi:ABC-type antimicrobial peptide transport system permease subunit